MTSPTGAQTSLSRGSVEATITQVGASLRALRVGGVDLIAPFAADRPAPMCSGVVLVPWPNRIEDGRWDDAGEPQQLSLTEPKFHNAIHGLLRFSPYTVDAAADRATLHATVFPQLGYRYLLDTSVEYALTDAGVAVTHRITNRSDSPAPVAVGIHPFITIGGVDPRELTLTIPASIQYDVNDRMIPTGTSTLDAPLAEGARLGDLTLDTGYTGLTRDEDGRVRHFLTAPDGRRVTLWQDEAFDYVQVFTTTDYPGQAYAVAVEPMTAPTNAFATDTDVRRLAPGETWTLSWGIELS